MKHLLLMGGLLVLVLAVAGGAGAGVSWWLQKEHAHDNAAGDVPTASEMPESQKLALSGDYDKAHEVINKGLDSPGISAQAKHDLLLQQGTVYEGEKKYDEAMASYLEAESLKESLQVVQAIANLASRNGDKKLEITYLKKAITLVPSDQAGEGQKRYLQDRIEYLETGKTPS